MLLPSMQDITGSDITVQKLDRITDFHVIPCNNRFYTPIFSACAIRLLDSQKLIHKVAVVRCAFLSVVVLVTELEEHDGEPQTDTPTAAEYHGRSRTVCCGHSG